MKIQKTKLLAVLMAALAAFAFVACSSDSDSGTDTKSEITADGIKIEGTLLSKTADVKVISAATEITGSEFPDASASAYYKGVFIKDRTVTLSPFIMAKYQVT